MNRLKKKPELPILLTAVLLFQLSFHTLHALSNHTKNTPAAHRSCDTLVNEAASTCASCLHFLSNHLYIAPLVFLVTGLVISSVTRIPEGFSPTVEPLALCLLRGPPGLRS